MSVSSVRLPVCLSIWPNTLFVYNKHGKGASPEPPSTYIWEYFGNIYISVCKGKGKIFI